MAPVVGDVVPIDVSSALILEEEVEGPTVVGGLYAAIQSLHGPQLAGDFIRSNRYVAHDHGRPDSRAHVDACLIRRRVAGQVVQRHPSNVIQDTSEISI